MRSSWRGDRTDPNSSLSFTDRSAPSGFEGRTEHRHILYQLDIFECFLYLDPTKLFCLETSSGLVLLQPRSDP